MPGPTATWNPARGVWETAEASILCEHSPVFSEIWPTSGSMRSGSLLPPRRSAPRTGGSGSSSSPGRLLKTPTTQLAINGGSQHPDKRKAGGHGPTLADEVEHLLPTPQAQDTGTPGRRASEGLRPPLSQVVLPLLPTPRASDGEKGGPNQRGSSGDLMLPSAAARLLSTPRASDGGPRGSSAGWGLRNEVKGLLPTPTATPYGNNQSPSAGAAVRPSLEQLAPKLLPTPTATSPSTANYRTDGTPYGGDYGPTLLDAVRLLPTPDATHGRKSTRTGPLLPGAVETLLPTPMAADGERASLAMPRGNPALAGAADSLGNPPSTGRPSRGGKRSSDGPHPGQLTIEDA